MNQENVNISSILTDTKQNLDIMLYKLKTIFNPNTKCDSKNKSRNFIHSPFTNY